MMRWFGLALIAAFLSQPAPAQSAAAFSIGIDQPAYTGLPLWVQIKDGPVESVRYPFNGAVEYLGCNTLELKRNGELVSPHPVGGNIDMSGLMCGSAAPSGSPARRLPLHALYSLDLPGTYAVRWTVSDPAPAASDWLTFTLLQAAPSQKEAWLRHMLDAAPTDDGLLAGDYLPSLLAAAPDPRALNVFVKYLYSPNQVVAGIGSSCLERFPFPAVKRAIVAAVEQRGASDAVAYFATYHSGWSREDESRIVHASLPPRTAAALKLLGFIFYTPNHAWPADPKLRAYVDRQVLEAAPALMDAARENIVQQLAEYLGSMPSSPAAHALLRRIAQRPGGAGSQAQISLTWHPQPADLPYLAAMLLAPGDPDPRGSDRSSLPYSLVKAYGADALPFLEHAVAGSPYVWVRTQSAQQLALRNRPLGFKFLLEAVDEGRPYKAEMIRWLEDSFSDRLPRDATEQQVRAFMQANIATHP